MKVIKAWAVVTENNKLMYFRSSENDIRISSVYLTRGEALESDVCKQAGEKVVPCEIKLKILTNK